MCAIDNEQYAGSRRILCQDDADQVLTIIKRVGVYI